MGVAKRLGVLLGLTADEVPDRVEDPRADLDRCRRGLENLLDAARGCLADAVNTRKRLDLQAGKLRQSAERLRGQAAEAARWGNDDLAREALTRRAAALEQVRDFVQGKDAVKAEEDSVTAAVRLLRTGTEAFDIRAEAIRAEYTLAEARVHVDDVIAGISAAAGGLEAALRRLADVVGRVRATAEAVDELLASGAMDDACLPLDGDNTLAPPVGSDDVDRELAAIRAGLRATPAAPTPPSGSAVTARTW